MRIKKSLESFLKLFVSRDLGERDPSIDALRGLAIAGMIMVNHAPPTTEIYGALVHSPWLGWTMADTIFPLFLFLVGFSISSSAEKRLKGRHSVPYGRIFRRTAILFLINIALVNFPYYEFDKLVVTGTLWRIASCYLLASLISYHSGWRIQAAIVIGVLSIQWWFLTQFEVPGFGSGDLSIAGNASVYLDKMLLGSFADRLMLNGPIIQGLLPGASSIASTLIGVMVGCWVRPKPYSHQSDRQIFSIGLLLLIAGASWGIVYPVSKILWTGSYVILMTGLSLLLLALFRWVDRMQVYRITAVPLQVAGRNALFFYVFAQVFQRVLVYGRIEQSDGSSARFRYLIYEQWIEPWSDGKFGSLVYTLVFLLFCYLVVVFLNHRRIFVKL